MPARRSRPRARVPRYPGPVWLVARGCDRARCERRRDCRRHRRAIEVVASRSSPQDRYDELLWACDVNFVRGEDSFVRAQWAGRPFVWHIYPHGRRRPLGEARPPSSRATPRGSTARRPRRVTALWEAWNRRGDGGDGADAAQGWPMRGPRSLARGGVRGRTRRAGPRGCAATQRSGRANWSISPITC